MRHVAAFARKAKNGENRRKIAPATLRERAERKKLVFFCSCTRRGVDFGRLGTLRSVPGRPFRRPGCPLALPGCSRGAPGALPRRSRDASGTIPGAMGGPEKVPASIWARFWVPRDRSRDRFWIDFCVDWPQEARIALTALPWSHHPHRIALTASPWPHRAGRIALAASSLLDLAANDCPND